MKSLCGLSLKDKVFALQPKKKKKPKKVPKTHAGSLLSFHMDQNPVVLQIDQSAIDIRKTKVDFM